MSSHVIKYFRNSIRSVVLIEFCVLTTIIVAAQTFAQSQLSNITVPHNDIIVSTPSVKRSFEHLERVRNVISDFGAKADVLLTNAFITIATGSPALIAKGADFDCAYLNRLSADKRAAWIEVPGAGGLPWLTLRAQIANCVDNSHLSLTVAAGQTLLESLQSIVYGSDDSEAFVKCAAIAHPCFIPAARYFAKNVEVASGTSLFSESPVEFGEYPDSSHVLPLILAAPGATSIFNVNGAKHVLLRGLWLNCNHEPATSGITGGSSQLDLSNMTIQFCSISGLGGSINEYTGGATIVNSEFFGNNVGISNLIDSAMIGGAVTSSTSDGIYQGDGATADNFVAVRVEWNKGNGYHFVNAGLNQIVGGLVDRNFVNGAFVDSSQVVFTGTVFRRNGAADSGAWMADSQIAAQGAATKLLVSSVLSQTGYNDDGSGSLSPKYFLVSNTTSGSPGLVEMNSSDLSGFKTAFASGSMPISYLLRDNIGVGNFSNLSYPAIGLGKSLLSYGLIKVDASGVASAKITIVSALATVGTWAPYAHHLFLYSVDYNTGAVHTVNFDMSAATTGSGQPTALYASTPYGEGGGKGYFAFSPSDGTIRLSTSGFATDRSGYILSIKNTGTGGVGIGWEVK